LKWLSDQLTLRKLKKNIMQTNNQTNIIFWDDHIDEKYGKPGTPERDKWEQEFEAFKLGVFIG